jgi:hypothetical protein
MKLVTGHDKKSSFAGHQLNKLVTKSTGQAGHGLVMTKLVIKASRPRFLLKNAVSIQCFSYFLEENRNFSIFLK